MRRGVKEVKKCLIIGVSFMMAMSGLMGGCSCEPIRTSVAGTYVNEDNPEWYIELKEDGTFYSREMMGEVFTGEWEIEGDKVVLKSPLGITITVTLKGDTIVTIDPLTKKEVVYKKGESPEEIASVPPEEEKPAHPPEYAKHPKTPEEVVIAFAFLCDKEDYSEAEKLCADHFIDNYGEPKWAWEKISNGIPLRKVVIIDISKGETSANLHLRFYFKDGSDFLSNPGLVKEDGRWKLYD